MKYFRLLPVLALLSCQPVPQASLDTPNICPDPPLEFGPGTLSGCNEEDGKQCCGYSFFTSSNNLCIAVLCRMKACDAWEYTTVICPEAPRRPQVPGTGGKAIHYDASEDEGCTEKA